MRDQHAAVQALAACGLGLRAIARELGIDRKTARRFALAATADQAVAWAISRPSVLDATQICSHVAACSCRPTTGHFSLSTTVPLKPSPKSVATPRGTSSPRQIPRNF